MPDVTCRVICYTCGLLDEYTSDEINSMNDAMSRKKGHVVKTGHVVYIEEDRFVRGMRSIMKVDKK